MNPSTTPTRPLSPIVQNVSRLSTNVATAKPLVVGRKRGRSEVSGGGEPGGNGGAVGRAVGNGGGPIGLDVSGGGGADGALGEVGSASMNSGNWRNGLHSAESSRRPSVSRSIF